MFVDDGFEFESAGLSETTEDEVADERDVEIGESGPEVGDVMEIGFLSEILGLLEQRNEHDEGHSCGDEEDGLAWSLRVEFERGIPLGQETLLIRFAHY